MNVLRFLKRVEPAAAAVVGVYNPLLGAGLNQVVLAEEAMPGEKRGNERKSLVMNSIAGMSPLLIPLLEQAAGRDLVDDEEFAAAVSDVVDALVRMLNAIKK